MSLWIDRDSSGWPYFIGIPSSSSSSLQVQILTRLGLGFHWCIGVAWSWPWLWTNFSSYWCSRICWGSFCGSIEMMPWCILEHGNQRWWWIPLLIAISRIRKLKWMINVKQYPPRLFWGFHRSVTKIVRDSHDWWICCWWLRSTALDNWNEVEFGAAVNLV